MKLRISPGLLSELSDQARVRYEMPDTDAAHAQGEALDKALKATGYDDKTLTPEEAKKAREGLESALDDIGSPYGLAEVYPVVKAAARRVLAKVKES